MPEAKKYIADLYLRLSKEDGDKEESDSISNQRDLLLDFVKAMPDIEVHEVRIDDGFSGVDFNRPSFNAMLEDIKAGIVNCVICKDLSRFGRNYIESGKYIQVLFPKTGVRFIAVNDHYDSAKVTGYTDSIIVPFKNMINDAYSADISGKIRSQLDIKRKNGDFIGSFAVYGYVKDPENKNKLMPDDYAAAVVRDIFKWKLEGMSAQGIANRLDAAGILSPMEYKRYLGMRFSTSFKVNSTARWSAQAVGRILKNEIYTGVLEQGKRVTPNYKVRQRVERPKEEWTRAENAHEPIIDRELFDTVQSLLRVDTRIASGEKAVYLFSGVAVCADCERGMVRKTVPKGGKKYYYYSCATNREDKSACTTHSINEAALEQAVFLSLKAHIDSILNLERTLRCIENLPYQQAEARKHSAQLAAKQEEIQRYSELRLSLYESYVSGVITKEDFISFKGSYDEKIREAERAALHQKEAIERIAAGNTAEHTWIAKFKEYHSIEALNRKTIVELIERVLVYTGGRIEIIFRYQNEYDGLLPLLKYREAV